MVRLYTLFDPRLTEKGVEQCRTLAAELEPKFPFTHNECLIVVSPLTRTLETAQHSLSWLQERGVPVEVRAEWQETTDNPCDIGEEVSVIQKDWPDFDFSGLDPVWPQKTGMYENTEEAFARRGEFAKQWLFDRPEKCIIVVTHSGFLRRIVAGEKKYQNVEYRTYRLVKDASSGELELKEFSRDKPLEQQ